ncbi:Por secretion system C-terminal sorting domain-containing protein [Flavobacterium fluvii]|uniref:Por secretion system C-terminal sorting domain-containing protein n=1 Tax=Flavobacterium fluvii TaxID=468056 RepID=A0A1M5E3J4_9FLAO|nr:T9SS type A sorting domain-containing protein [Flavobacterium fluvii]SHF73819.1 Por secretion system C-terminal sorting domain-containing protein [Flavobacterium fluvii]
MKKFLLYISLLFASVNLWSQVTITETGGWMESAFVKWSPVAGADSYNVYYTGVGKTDVKIDTQLIRRYNTYFRADVLGLAAGNYTITVKPVTASVEGTGTTTANINVLAHDRNGFAFEGGRIPGGYNIDGTLKSGAVVLYITQNTKNTVSLNVTGATTNPCVGLQTILDGFKKGSDNRPLVVRLIGNITDLSSTVNPADPMGGDVVIENKNNASGSITFEGVGSDAVANGWGLRIKTASNIEVRNLGFMLTNADEGDNIGLQQANDHIWVHNCDLFYGAAGGDADQAKGDGAMDCKKSTYVTFSYNHFLDSGKCNLLGLSEGTTAGLYITYHHNWYDHSDSRHPRVRYYSAHVYNNYYDGNSKYGAGSTLGSSVFMEGNFFRNCKYPMLTSMQGTDVYGGAEGTFSGEAGGTIKAFNNTMSGQTRYVPYNATTYPVEFDAIETSTRGEVISSSITSKSGANAYNNFDTDPALYVKNLTIDDPTVAKNKVIQYSGRISGGDLKWTFNNAVDDTSSEVNAALMTALTTYTSGLVYVQGENTQTLTSTSNTNQTVASGTAISNIVYTWGGDATDANVPELTVLNAAGISAVKNLGAKTTTISGIPTADVSFSVVTNGTSGTPVTLTGTIAIGSATPSDQIHNFTASGTTNTFYTISGDLSTSKGTVVYGSSTLTQCIKTNTAVAITYTTSQASTLMLLFATAGSTIKIDNTTYTATAAVAPNTGGVITVNLLAGTHNIARGNSENALFYMKTSYTTLGLNDNTEVAKLTLYPNPVTNQLYFSSSDRKINTVAIYNLTGALVKSISNAVDYIDVSNLTSGGYLVKVTTDQGSFTQKIIKK